MRREEAVPALQQMLQVEDAPIRNLLVEILSGIKTPDATRCLAQRAIFDLNPDVRKAATAALKDRDKQDYQEVILQGLRYPWPAVNDHTAETVVSLERKDLVPSLVKMLKEPDPCRPYKDEEKTVVREVVAMNHMSNCMVCHACSHSPSDLVRGRVPVPDERPQPAYYQSSNPNDIFIRGNITFLKQDFSLMQPVENPGTWPATQRFDYMVRNRKLNEIERAGYERLKLDLPKYEPTALLFALRELTGKDLGKTYQDWMPLATPVQVPTTPLLTPLEQPPSRKAHLPKEKG
jgi:hypothetical protein